MTPTPAGFPSRVDIVYRDERVVVVDKPPGLLVHRSARADDPTALLQILRDQIQHYVYPVHRIDRPSSGLVVFGLSKAAAAGLQRSMSAPEASKDYLALVRGHVAAEGRSDRPLTGGDGRPRAASTEWQRLATGESCSLLRVRITTGRHHQIRRHMAHLGQHLLGDSRYGKGRINHRFRQDYGLPRLFLHAWRLRIPHPLEDRVLALEAPLAADLAACLQRIPGLDPAVIARLVGGDPSLGALAASRR